MGLFPFLLLLCLLVSSFGEAQQPHPSPAAGRQVSPKPHKQETEQPVIITATRHAQAGFDLPYAAHAINLKRALPTRMFQDLLQVEPAVRLQRTSSGQVSPFLRGLTGYHTLMMIDGIRLNNSVLRSGPNEYWGLVDPFSLDRVEVVMGPASVLHGSDAVGGAVNAITTRRKLFQEGLNASVRTAFRYSSAEASFIGRTQVQGNVGPHLGFSIGATGSAFGDLDAGGSFGRQPRTGFHNRFGDVRFDLHANTHWTFTTLLQGARIRNVRRTHKTIFGVSFHGTSVGNERRRDFNWDRDLVAFILAGRDLKGWIHSAKLRLSYQRIKETRDRVRSNFKRDVQGFNVRTFGLGLELSSKTAIGRLTYGLDEYHDVVDSFRNNFAADGSFLSRSIQGPVGDDATYDLFGLFLQDEIHLSDTWQLILGTRFTVAAAEASKVKDPVSGERFGIDKSWTNLVGSARLLWKPRRDLRFYGGISQAFRAPNLSDLTRLDSARSNEIEVPSPNLDPEDFVTFELGAKSRLGGLRTEVTAWYTIINDLIIRQPTGEIIEGDSAVVKRNAGNGHVQGVSVRARYDFGEHWWSFGSFSWIDGIVDTFPTSAPVRKKEALSRLAPLQGRLGLGWKTGDGRFRIWGEGVAVHHQGRLNSRDRADTQRIPPGGTPGYAILNLNLTYRLNQKTRFFLSLENLLDKNYRIHGSGLQEPGFNTVVGFDMTF